MTDADKQSNRNRDRQSRTDVQADKQPHADKLRQKKIEAKGVAKEDRCLSRRQGCEVNPAKTIHQNDKTAK